MSVTTLIARDYQQETIDATYAAYGDGHRRVAAVLPTGGGKTVVFSIVAADAVRQGRRVLVLAHRTELIAQAEKKLRESSEGLDVGVLQGRRRETYAHVVVASVQTAVRPGALELLRQANFGLVIVDEVHHVAAASYQTILKKLEVFTPGGPLLLGVTATLDRADGIALGDTIEHVASKIPMDRLIRDGHLLRPKGIRVKVEGLDLSRVKRSRTSDSGLDDKAVASAMKDALAPEAIARAVLEHGKGRRGVAFLPSVEMSQMQARAFADAGLRSVHVDAGTPGAVRDEIMRRARLGEYDMVCNVGLFTEGTDVPIWDLAVLARPTSSGVLFQQMAGRPMRPYPGQRDCLLLDLVGNFGRHNLQQLVSLHGVEMIDDLDDDLLEFEEDEQERAPREGSELQEKPELIDGELAYELVDVFGASHTAWQHSPRGVWWLPPGVYLAPGAEIDTYDVRAVGEREPLHEACDLSAAMAWGDKAATERAERDLSRDATWRHKKPKRFDRLQAIYQGLATPEQITNAGTLADVKDARWAACNIDVLATVAAVTPQGYWTT